MSGTMMRVDEFRRDYRPGTRGRGLLFGEMKLMAEGLASMASGLMAGGLVSKAPELMAGGLASKASGLLLRRLCPQCCPGL